MGRTTNLTQKMKLFSFGALGLARGQASCPPYQETWPLTTIKLTQEAIDSGNDGCTAGGHDGQLYSKCWVSCQDGYDMIFKNTGARGAIEETVNERNKVGIKCKSTGNWRAENPFYCREACPKMYNNGQNFAQRTIYEWDNGFILRIRIEPVMDMDEWTAVLWFAEAPSVPLTIETYETYSETTSASGRVSAFCSYDSIAAGEQKKMIVVVVGASVDDLPSMQVRYMPGIHKDLSCIFDDEDFGGTTTTGATTTTGPRDPEDPNFCEGKNDGFYVHPVCSKYYHCASGVTNIRECGPGTVWNPNAKICDWEYNVDTFTAATRIQLRRQRQVHQRQRQQHRQQQRQQRHRHPPQLQHQHQQLLLARTTTNSARENQMGTTDTANARNTTNATSLARL